VILSKKNKRQIMKNINTILNEKKISLIDIFYLTKYSAKAPLDKEVFGAKTKIDNSNILIYKKEG